MEQDDELEQLLGEIPRATSAPPQVEVHGMQPSVPYFGSGQGDMARFVSSGQAENVYGPNSDSSFRPVNIPSSYLSQYYGGPSQRKQMKQLQKQIEPQSSVNQHQRQHMEAEDDPLPSAFMNLSLDPSSSLNHVPAEDASAINGTFTDAHLGFSNGILPLNAYVPLPSMFPKAVLAPMYDSSLGTSLYQSLDGNSGGQAVEKIQKGASSSLSTQASAETPGVKGYVAASPYFYPLPPQMLGNDNVGIGELSYTYPMDYDLAAALQAQQQAQLVLQQQQRAVQQQLEDRISYKKQIQAQIVLHHQLRDQRLDAHLYGLHQAALNGVVPAGQSLPQTGSHQATFHPLLSLSSQNQPSFQRSSVQATRNLDLIEHQSLALSNGDSLQTAQATSVCRYYAQGHCSRGELCQYRHTQPQILKGLHSISESRDAVVAEDHSFPERIFSRRSSRVVNTAVTTSLSAAKKKSIISANGHAYPNADDSMDSMFSSSNLSFQFLETPEHLELDLQRQLNLSQQAKYASLNEIKGRIYSIAKDQHGCRFLQRKFDEGVAEDVEKIFLEIIDHIIELMTDPFGNYLIQKLLEVCTEDQRMQILHAVTRNDELVNISVNMHGTRAVQKLVETLKSPEQVLMAVSSLKHGVVKLIKDLNGNHVVQRCLQKLRHEDSQFIYDAAAAHCVDIATHRHGCCVLQRCVDHASESQKRRLIAEIANNALILSQDQYGNYAVQYILDLKGTPWASMEVMSRLEGNYALLSMQKFSSNVVEKCLKLQGFESNKARIVRELMNSTLLPQLLQDPFANYVMQCALTETKGNLHSALVEAIRPHHSALRSSPYGKRILSRTNLKK